MGSLACGSCKFGHANFPPRGNIEGVRLQTTYLPLEEAIRVMGAYKQGYGALSTPLECAFVKNRMEEVRTGLFKMKTRTKIAGISKWWLPHRCFAKSHLRIREGVYELDGGRNNPVYGCVLCDRKGVVKNFETSNALRLYIKDKHDETEHEREVDIERVS